MSVSADLVSALFSVHAIGVPLSKKLSGQGFFSETGLLFAETACYNELGNLGKKG